MNREIKFRAWDGCKKLGYKQHGYQKRKAEWHPNCDKRGYVMEHRLIMEAHLGRYLPKNAIIHHKNHVRDDNRIENLEYMEEQERHAKHHDSGKRNDNGQFVASSPEFNNKKFRLLNKNTGLMQVFTLQKLISTTFRKSQFEYRGEFTGLKDKNGVEIYENDLLRIPPKSQFEETTYNCFEVFYHDNECIGGQNIGFCMNRMHTQGSSAGGRGYKFTPESIATHGFIVIGNIHEHKELLK